MGDALVERALSSRPRGVARDAIRSGPRGALRLVLPVDHDRVVSARPVKVVVVGAAVVRVEPGVGDQRRAVGIDGRAEGVEVTVVRPVDARVERHEGLLGGCLRGAKDEKARDGEELRALGRRGSALSTRPDPRELGVDRGERSIDQRVLIRHDAGSGGAEHGEPAVRVSDVGQIVNHRPLRGFPPRRDGRLVLRGPCADLGHETEHEHVVKGGVLDVDAVGVDVGGPHHLEPLESRRAPRARPLELGQVVREHEERGGLREAVVCP